MALDASGNVMIQKSIPTAKATMPSTYWRRCFIWLGCGSPALGIGAASLLSDKQVVALFTIIRIVRIVGKSQKTRIALEAKKRPVRTQSRLGHTGLVDSFCAVILPTAKAGDFERIAVVLGHVLVYGIHRQH